MKIQFLILFLLLSCKVCISDTLDIRKFDYSKADSIALSFTKKYKSPEKLAKALIENLTTEHEKYRVIFKWVTNNISYNIANKNIDCRYTLKKGSALCSGYSNLIFELCKIANLECKIVNGYAKSYPKHIGKFNRTNHAWNLIKLNNNWYISDATWAAGYVSGRRFTKEFNNFYFLANPDEIKFNHYPAENDWFLTDDIFSLKDFEKMPIFRTQYFNLGIKTDKVLNGLLKNRLRFKFTSDSEIFSSSIKFDREKEFRQIHLEKDSDGYYIINLELDRYLKGPCRIYLNRESVIVFVKK
jgi:transglutaminase/protease-like cytokinesis protein 3